MQRITCKAEKSKITANNIIFVLDLYFYSFFSVLNFLSAKAVAHFTTLSFAMPFAYSSYATALLHSNENSLVARIKKEEKYPKKKEITRIFRIC